MIEVNAFKETWLDQDRSFLYWDELTIKTGIIIILLRLNKYNKASLMGTLIHLVCQMNLIEIVIEIVFERYSHIGTVLIELKAL